MFEYNDYNYANKQEEAFHKYLIENFSNVKVIANKQIVDRRKVVEEIDFIIFVGKRIFVVELKSYSAVRISGNLTRIELEYSLNNIKPEKNPFNNISSKSRKIHRKIENIINRDATVSPVIIYGDPVKGTEPNIDDIIGESKEVSYRLSEFYSLLEREEKQTMPDSVLEAYNHLNADLQGITREIPKNIIICDVSKQKNLLVYDERAKKYSFKNSITKSFILPIELKLEEGSTDNIDKSRFNEVLHSLAYNINNNLGLEKAEIEE